MVLLIVMGDAEPEMYGYEITKAMKLDDVPVQAGRHLSRAAFAACDGAARQPCRGVGLRTAAAPIQITEDGRKALAEWLTAWRDLRGFVDNAINSDRSSK